VRRPDFFIVGAPKCGTSAMSVYLAQHPEVFVPHVKEPHFFGSDLSSTWFGRDEQRYLSLFSAARDEKRLGEASVYYLLSKRAAEEIKEFEPLARIIVMLRDPVEMLHSLHSQHLYTGAEDIADFGVALDAEEDRKRGLRIPRGPRMSDDARIVESLFYREIASYTRQVERYYRAFGRENVHVVIYDDFRDDTAGKYEETLRFLDVDPGFRPEFPVVNANKRVWNKALQVFLQNPPPVARRLVRTLIPPPARWKLQKYVKSYNSRYEARKPMDAELSKRLRAEFAPEVERLSELLGRDLTHWSRP
jgi:hypothetical protein